MGRRRPLPRVRVRGGVRGVRGVRDVRGGHGVRVGRVRGRASAERAAREPRAVRVLGADDGGRVDAAQVRERRAPDGRRLRASEARAGRRRALRWRRGRSSVACKTSWTNSVLNAWTRDVEDAA